MIIFFAGNKNGDPIKARGKIVNRLFSFYYIMVEPLQKKEWLYHRRKK